MIRKVERSVEMSAVMPQYLQALSILPEEDRKAVLSVGVAFRRVDVEKRLARAQSILQDFQAKYNTTLEQLESEGLPDDADYKMHEDYIEWYHWARVAEKARKTLETLHALAESSPEQ
jgi:hypothetical protein